MLGMMFSLHQKVTREGKEYWETIGVTRNKEQAQKWQDEDPKNRCAGYFGTVRLDKNYQCDDEFEKLKSDKIEEDSEEIMKDKKSSPSKKKEVLEHLKEDVKESKKSIKEDKKLSKKMKKGKC